MSQENDDSKAEEPEADENQYGGGEGEIDPVEQTEGVTDEDEQSTDEDDEE